MSGHRQSFGHCCLSKYSLRCYLLAYALHRTVSDFDIPAGETLFLKYGSNVRDIIDVLKRPEAEATYDLDVKREAADIAKDFSTTLLHLEHLDFKSRLSSKIFFVRPNNLELRLPVLTIPTAYLFKTLAVAVCRQALTQQHAVFPMLTVHPPLGTAAGWWFENYAHVMLSDPTRPPIPTHIRSVSNPPSIPAPKGRSREPNFEVLMDSFVSETQSESNSTPHLHPIDRQPRASRRFAGS